MKKVIKWVSIPALIVLLPLTAFFLYIANGIAEVREVDGSSLRAWWFIPTDVRAVEIPALCAAPTYSKNYLECGGICGVVYSINVSTTASQADISSAARSAAGDDYELEIFGIKEDAETCQDVTVDYVKRY